MSFCAVTTPTAKEVRVRLPVGKDARVLDADLSQVGAPGLDITWDQRWPPDQGDNREPRRAPLSGLKVRISNSAVCGWPVATVWVADASFGRIWLPGNKVSVDVFRDWDAFGLESTEYLIRCWVGYSHAPVRGFGTYTYKPVQISDAEPALFGIAPAAEWFDVLSGHARNQLTLTWRNHNSQAVGFEAWEFDREGKRLVNPLANDGQLLCSSPISNWATLMYGLAL